MINRVPKFFIFFYFLFYGKNHLDFTFWNLIIISYLKRWTLDINKLEWLDKELCTNCLNLLSIYLHVLKLLNTMLSWNMWVCWLDRNIHILLENLIKYFKKKKTSFNILIWSIISSYSYSHDSLQMRNECLHSEYVPTDKIKYEMKHYGSKKGEYCQPMLVATCYPFESTVVD